MEVGEPAVLECNVEGSPRPSIRWFKDEEPFTLSDGMHLTDFDRYLIIMNAAGRDGGTYTCEATNSLGVRTDTAKLVVTQSKFPSSNLTICHKMNVFKNYSKKYPSRFENDVMYFTQ